MMKEVAGCGHTVLRCSSELSTGSWKSSDRGKLRMLHDRLKQIPETEKLAMVCQDTGFTNGQFFVTISAIALGALGIVNSCQEYTLPRDQCQSDPKGVVGNNTTIGPVLEALDHSTFLPIRNRDQNWFIGRSWINILGRHQQGC